MFRLDQATIHREDTGLLRLKFTQKEVQGITRKYTKLVKISNDNQHNRSLESFSRVQIKLFIKQLH